MRTQKTIRLICNLGIALAASWFLVGCDTDDGGSGDDDGDSEAPRIGSLTVGFPVCSPAGGGSSGTKTVNGNAATVDVYPSCEASNSTIRVSLQVNALSDVEFFEWTLEPWNSQPPHGSFTNYDSIVNQGTNSQLIVRTTDNTVTYVSAPVGALRSRLTETFNDVVKVTVWNKRTNHSTAFISIYILAKPGTNDPSLLVGDGFRPSLSPDATRFVFTRLSDFTENARSEIWIAKSDGTNLRRLASDPNASFYSPQWGPNGQIAVVRKDGIYDTNRLGTLFRINADGSGLQQVSDEPLVRDFAFFTQSGNTFVVADYNNSGLFVSESEWPSPGRFSSRARDGRGITPRGQPEASGNSRVVTVDKQLTPPNDIVVFTPNPLSEIRLSSAVRFGWPNMSPSGENVIASALNAQTNGLYIIDLAAGTQTPLTVAEPNTLDLQPTWSRTTVLFVYVPSHVRVEHGDIYIQRGVSE